MAGRAVTIDDVVVIEAVWGKYDRVGITNRVIPSRTLRDLDGHVKGGVVVGTRKWIVGRLMEANP